MSQTRKFHQLDVFSAEPLMGNALAVVHQAEGLDDEALAAFARWTNLAETTFLLPPTHPDADYRVRIFTIDGELPFAGHPTLGSCRAWLEAGGRPRNSGQVIQECGIGLVRVRQSKSRLAFAAPPLRRSGPLDEALVSRIADGLGIPSSEILAHQWVDNGPGFCAVMLESAAKVLALKPDRLKLRGMEVGVLGPQVEGADSDFEVRAFVTSEGVPEDPATGSLNAGLAVWLTGAGLAPDHYCVAQGTALGRRARIFIDREGEDIWVGGDCAVVVDGSVNLG